MANWLKATFVCNKLAFIYFMMDHPQRKTILAKLIKREQQNICNWMDTETIEQHLEVPLDVL